MDGEGGYTINGRGRQYGNRCCKLVAARNRGLSLPPPFIPPDKGEGGFDISLYSLNSISGTKPARRNPMLTSPSPLWGGIKGGGN